jgi:hypothetical protein
MSACIIDKDRAVAQDPAIEGNEVSLPLPQLVVLEQAETEVVAGGFGCCLACGLGGVFGPLPPLPWF